MRSNGYGSFIQNIVIKVPLSQASAMSEALKTEPIAINQVMGSASFSMQMTGTRQGDDETVVYKLMNMLPDGIRWRVDWQKSDY